jgi:hypothetical protein
MNQIETTKLEKQLIEPHGEDAERTARTIFWIRLANLIAVAQEALSKELKDRG